MGEIVIRYKPHRVRSPLLPKTNYYFTATGPWGGVIGFSRTVGDALSIVAEHQKRRARRRRYGETHNQTAQETAD